MLELIKMLLLGGGLRGLQYSLNHGEGVCLLRSVRPVYQRTLAPASSEDLFLFVCSWSVMAAAWHWLIRRRRFCCCVSTSASRPPSTLSPCRRHGDRCCLFFFLPMMLPYCLSVLQSCCVSSSRWWMAFAVWRNMSTPSTLSSSHHFSFHSVSLQGIIVTLTDSWLSQWQTVRTFNAPLQGQTYVGVHVNPDERLHHFMPCEKRTAPLPVKEVGGRWLWL